MSMRHFGWIAFALAAAFFVGAIASAEDKAKDLDKIPKAVMETLKSKFPKAEITKWSKETEKGTVVYDLEFTESGKKAEMDVKEDGTIINIERVIEAKDLPEAVAKAVEKKFPKATLKEVMECKAGKEEKLEGYEIVLVTEDKKHFEIMVDPTGKIVEEEELKKEEKK